MLAIKHPTTAVVQTTIFPDVLRHKDYIDYFTILQCAFLKY